jgi:hypothetical protein
MDAFEEKADGVLDVGSRKIEAVLIAEVCGRKSKKSAGTK